MTDSASPKSRYAVNGVGLGLRRALVGPLTPSLPAPLAFLELTPENWIGVGGRLGKRLRSLTERYPFVSHGLSLSLGSPAPLDTAFVRRLAEFLRAHGVRKYTEHLSYCSDDGHLYDLMPIPFTEAAARHVSERISQVQDMIGERMAVENVSYYAAPETELSELEFIQRVLEQADCELLLDVNNVYVNSVNHRYDPAAFIDALPGERIAYVHVAGHYREAEDLIVDTHGAPVVDPVWRLLEHTYERFGPVPTLLERDFNLPPLDELLRETATISHMQKAAPPSTSSMAEIPITAV